MENIKKHKQLNKRGQALTVHAELLDSSCPDIDHERNSQNLDIVNGVFLFLCQSSLLLSEIC
jgi:hypothetical protein